MMMKHISILMVMIIIGLVLVQCDDDEGNSTNSCPDQVIISQNDYETAPADLLTILSMDIDGDCLTINFAASGCDGNSWELKLIDSEAIMESLPAQRNVRLSLKNTELCAAVITEEISFDISGLQLNENDSVILHITNSEDSILYEY